VQYNRVFRTLALALIFSLLAAIAATPALAANASLSPTSGAVGTAVTVKGNSFEPATAVFIYFSGDSALVGADITDLEAYEQVAAEASDDTGHILIYFDVPEKLDGEDVTSGTYYVYTSYTEEGEILTTDTFTVVGTSISISGTSGYVGDTVTVSGTRFAASSNVTIYFDSTSVGTTSTDDDGTFDDVTFNVPSSYRGSHTIKAQDASDNYATATFAVGQKITIAPTSGGSGIAMTVTGTGFSASKPVTIKYNATAVTTTPASINTDAKGSFTASFIVPTGLAGTYAVEASDGTNSASANYTMAINITISTITSAASPGHVGMSVTISGTGFQPDSKINITYASVPIAVATTSSDYTGAFSATFKIPKSEHGNHTITASDGTNTMQASFVIESTAPATPKLVLPPSDEKAKSRAFLDWENVTKDVNNADELSTPVTYDLQIASDADFTNTVLEKTELTTSGYTLLKGETLKSTKKEAPYYWRVRAVDAASNAGDWTSSRTFYVGGSDWGLYCLIGAGVLLIFFLGFWAGRKSKSSEYY